MARPAAHRLRTVARRLLALSAGAGCWALAMPPVDQPLFGWLALVPLLVIVRRVRPRAALAWGAFFGFAVGWAVTWWLALAVAGYFDAGVLAGAVAMSAGYGVALSSTFGVFAAAASWLLRRERGLRGHVAVAALWVASELVRVRVFGQPWGLLGYTQHGVLPMIQLVTLTGVYGLSFLLVLAADGLAAAWTRRAHPVRALALPATAVAAACLAGGLAIPAPESRPDAQPVAVVQSNVAPAFRWTRAFADQQLLANLRTTERGLGDARPALIVWPENALPMVLEDEPGLQAQLGRLAQRFHADLLLGGPRRAHRQVFNSARLLRPGGALAGHVDKRRLVVFAEAPPVDTGAAHAADDDESPSSFTPGRGTGVLPGMVPLGVSICHEALYPEVPATSVLDGAAVLVNVANDGWLDQGHGVGSRQHAAMVALRAVETRRWLVRSATTGVSMLVDPWGRIVAALPPGTAGVLQGSVVPRAGLTPYVRVGDVFAFACVALAALIVAPHALPRRRRRLVPAPAAA